MASPISLRGSWTSNLITHTLMTSSIIITSWPLQILFSFKIWCYYRPWNEPVSGNNRNIFGSISNPNLLISSLLLCINKRNCKLEKTSVLCLKQSREPKKQKRSIISTATTRENAGFKVAFFFCRFYIFCSAKPHNASLYLRLWVKSSSLYFVGGP